MCDKENTSLQCGKCKVAKYCSAVCQKRHWKYQHKEECRPCISDPLLLGHIFEGRSRNQILEYASALGSDRYQDRGYPSLQGVAMALQVSTKEFMSGILAAPGEISEDIWARHWTPVERATLLGSNPISTEHSLLAGRLSPPFTVLMEEDGEVRRLPLRLYSSLDAFDRLQLTCAYSDHEGIEALKYFARHFHDEDEATFLSLTKTCVENDISFGVATESMHDGLDRREYTATQVALTPGFEEVAEAATSVGLLTPMHVRSRANNEMYQVCGIELWPVLE